EWADVSPNLLAGVTPEALQAAYFRAITPKPKPAVSLDHVTTIHTTVADAITEVADEVRRAGRLTFRQLVAGLTDRMELVVRFLAALELAKQGLVDLDQLGGNFGTLVLAWTGEVDATVAVGELVGADVYDG
ncbi:MAG: segregation/condensation protein A, partial [Acidimicrobiia bacterium]|nr:segregation/condensation protein A [Acidimicrobiia bacterium]